MKEFSRADVDKKPRKEKLWHWPRGCLSCGAKVITAHSPKLYCSVACITRANRGALSKEKMKFGGRKPMHASQKAEAQRRYLKGKLPKWMFD